MRQPQDSQPPPLDSTPGHQLPQRALSLLQKDRWVQATLTTRLGWPQAAQHSRSLGHRVFTTQRARDDAGHCHKRSQIGSATQAWRVHGLV